MERIINLHIEKLPEGVYLATSDDIQGLVVQGRAPCQKLWIARDVARRLLEAQEERRQGSHIPAVSNSFDCSLVVGA